MNSNKAPVALRPDRGCRESHLTPLSFHHRLVRPLIFLLVTFLAAGSSVAGPVNKDHVAADAKWLVHLDLDNFLSTQIGEFVAREFLDKHFAKVVQGLKQQFNIDVDWRQIHGLTAYGTDFKRSPQANGVLVVKSSLNIAERLDAIIEQASQSGGKMPLQLEDAPFPLYSANKEIFGAPGPGDLFLLSKSRDQLEKARNVLTGAAPNLAASKSFPSFAQTTSGFLTATVADAFNAGVKLPPPAQGLKNADGAQVVAGEKADNFFLNLALNAKDSGSATQMQQVVQGLVALATLSQTENKDLQQLVQAIKVGGAQKTVTVNVELPATDVIAKVSETQQKKRARKK